MPHDALLTIKAGALRVKGAPSKNVTPMPLTYHAGWVRLPKVKKAVPVSDRVLRSHVAKKKFRGLTVTPLNGLDFGP